MSFLCYFITSPRTSKLVLLSLGCLSGWRWRNQSLFYCCRCVNFRWSVDGCKTFFFFFFPPKSKKGQNFKFILTRRGIVSAASACGYKVVGWHDKDRLVLTVVTLYSVNMRLKATFNISILTAFYPQSSGGLFSSGLRSQKKQDNSINVHLLFSYPSEW